MDMQDDRRRTGELPGVFRLLPLPRRIDLVVGPGLAPDRLRALRLGGGLVRPEAGPVLGRLPATGGPGPGCVGLELSGDPDLPESSQGYDLRIAADRVELRSRGPAGIFHGCATLAQLVEDAIDTRTRIPACRISDEPAMAYRAVHFDVKHHLDTTKYYYDAIDRLASFKVNAVVFEFEDKLRYRRRAAAGGPLSIGIEEMAAFTRYASRRFIEISPLVQGLGHAAYILKHPGYAPLRERGDSRWAFCPLREETYAVLFDLYRDAMDATPGSRYLHVGGDEVRLLGSCPECRAFVEREGRLALFLHWLNRVCAFVRGAGRVPVFWDDMIFKAAGVWDTMCRDLPPHEVEAAWENGIGILDGLVDRFPRDAVFMRWNYSHGRQNGNARALAWCRERGLATWIATAAQCGDMMLLPRAEQVANIRSFVALAAETGVPGTLCTAWDDRSPHMETYWRGWMAAADSAWTGQVADARSFETACLQRAHGTAAAGALTLHADLDSVCRESWIAMLTPGATRERPGERLDLPDASAPGAWTARHADRVAAASACLDLHRRTAERIADLAARSVRGRFTLRILAAVNDLAATPALLIRALAACDKPPEADSAETLDAVRNALEVFENRWTALLAVYGETRFLAYPAGFVEDRYFHPASRREDPSWMIEIEEELHPRIRSWLDERRGAPTQSTAAREKPDASSRGRRGPRRSPGSSEDPPPPPR